MSLYLNLRATIHAMPPDTSHIETLKFLKHKKIELLKERRKRAGITPLNIIREHDKQLALTLCNLPNRYFFGGNRPLAYGSQVRLSDGTSKSIENIIVGDTILSWEDGRSVPSKVSAIPFDGECDCIGFEFDNFTVYSSFDHEWPVTINAARGFRKRTSYNIYSLKGSARFLSGGIQEFNNNQLLPFSGLCLGLFLGGGGSGCQPSGDSPRPNFSNKDPYRRRLFIEAISKAYPSDFMHSHCKPSDPNRVYVTGSRKGGNLFANDLKSLGLLGKKSHEKFIPDIFLTSSWEQRIGLVHGMLLTAAHVDKSSAIFYSCSEQLLRDYQEILRSLGACSTFNGRRRPLKATWHRQFYLKFSVGWLYKWGLANMEGSRRKYDHCPSRMGERGYLLRRASPVGKMQCRCITVDHPSHTFLLTNGIITGNTGKTEWNAHEIARFLHKRHPVIPLHSELYRGKSIEGWSACPSYDVQEETTQPKILACLDPNRILDTHKLRGDILLKLKYKADDGTTSVLNFKSFEQGRTKFQGAGKDFVSFDEEPPKDVFDEATIRSKAGFPLYVWLTLTPVNGMCFDEETFILSPRGWLGIDDMRIGDEIYTLNRDTHLLELKEVDFVYRGAGRPLVSMKCRGFNALVTENHRWWVKNGREGKFETKETHQLRSHHVIPCAIPTGFEGHGLMDDWYVELIGWFVREGHYDVKTRRITISQSLSRYPAHCASIEGAFTKSKKKWAFSESLYHRGEKCQGVARQYRTVDQSLVQAIMGDCPNKTLTVKFVSQLDHKQQELLYEIMIKGDGNRNSNGDRFTAPLSQKETVDSFVALSHALGRRAAYTLEGTKILRVHVQRSKRFKPWTRVSSLTMKTVPYSKRIWCPHTPNETVIALRNGTSYISQNTWIYDNIYLNTSDPRQRVVTAEWDDNCFLTEEQKLEMAARFTPEALLVRQKGLFVQRTGLVCPWFRRDIHMVDDILSKIPKGSDVYCGIDFGYSAPCVVVYVAIDHQGTRYVFDGFYRKFLLTPQIADLMKRKEAAIIAAGFQMRTRYGDAASPSDIAELTQLGLTVIPVKKETGESKDSWDEYRARLFDAIGRVQPGTGKPQIYISNTLIEIDEKAKDRNKEFNWALRELENLRWDEIRRSGIITQKPMWSDKCDKHFCDAWSYIESMFMTPPETDEVRRARERDGAYSGDNLENDGWVL